jgi:hypothetical protein
MENRWNIGEVPAEVAGDLKPVRLDPAQLTAFGDSSFEPRNKKYWPANGWTRKHKRRK